MKTPDDNELHEMLHHYIKPKKENKKPTMKDNLNSLWANTRSIIYAGLTLGGVLIILMGSVVLLPLIIILVVGVVFFIAYRISIEENENN